MGKKQRVKGQPMQWVKIHTEKLTPLELFTPISTIDAKGKSEQELLKGIPVHPYKHEVRIFHPEGNSIAQARPGKDLYHTLHVKHVLETKGLDKKTKTYVLSEHKIKIRYRPLKTRGTFSGHVLSHTLIGKNKYHALRDSNRKFDMERNGTEDAYLMSALGKMALRSGLERMKAMTHSGKPMFRIKSGKKMKRTRGKEKKNQHHKRGSR